MRKIKFVTLLSSLLLAVPAMAAFDNSVPEFFYQPDDAQNVLEGALSYGDSTDSDLNRSMTTASVSFMHGISHNIGLRLGLSYSVANDLNGGNGFNNLNLDIVGHNSMAGIFRLHYGVLGSVTPNKAVSQRFSTVHVFNPYVGVSMGEEIEFGARFMYRSVFTSGDVWGNFDYSVSAFAEMDRPDSYLIGAALDYNQESGMDDNIDFNFYSMIYMKSFTLIPRINYNMQMDDAQEDSYNVELAARFML